MAEFSSRVKWESSESRGVTDGDRFEQQMEYVRASERQEDEFEYVCALYGPPFGATTVGAIFGGVVEQDGLRRTILVLYYWDRQLEERVTRVRGWW